MAGFHWNRRPESPEYAPISLPVGVFSLCVALAVGCAENPATRIIGTWGNVEGTVWVQFSPDGRFQGKFQHLLDSNVALPSALEDTKIDLGFQFIVFKGGKKFPGLIRRFGDPTAPPHEIELDYTPMEGKLAPWVKRLLYSDPSGALILRDAPMQGASSAEPGSEPHRAAIVAYLAGGTTQIQGLVFTPTQLDLESRWVGMLNVHGSYRFTKGNDFEVTIPITTASGSFELLLCQGTVHRRSVYIKAVSIPIIAVTLSPLKSSGPSNQQPSTAGFRVGAVAGVHGIRVDQDIYVNTGIITGRMQNIAFRLPGGNDVGGFVPTEPERSEIPVITVNGGGYKPDTSPECREAHASDSMTIPKGAKLSMVLAPDGSGAQYGFQVKAPRKR